MKGVSNAENDLHTSSGLQQFTDKTHKGDAGLEFIKHVCAVLALDENVQHDVLVILVLLIKSLYCKNQIQSVFQFNIILTHRNICAVCFTSSHLQRNVVNRCFIQ